MFRAMIGAAIGAALGTSALAGYGLWLGFTQGCDWRQPVLPPGFEAAVTSALALLLYLGWAPFAAGGVIGGLAGFGSWLVRPRKSVSRV